VGYCITESAPVLRQYVVDELHSIENKADILVSQVLDDFCWRSKFTLVLWQFSKFTRLVKSPGLKLAHHCGTSMEIVGAWSERDGVRIESQSDGVWERRKGKPDWRKSEDGGLQTRCGGDGHCGPSSDES